ncbi:MAG: hypothetical protein WCP16_04080 [Pseudanabaena sp. ELA645]|jgi:hypothetical protein
MDARRTVDYFLANPLHHSLEPVGCRDRDDSLNNYGLAMLQAAIYCPYIDNKL